jgi:hypothetical protein
VSVEEGYRIDSPEKAGVALRKYSSLMKKKEQNEELARIEMIRIAAWREEANAKVDNNLDFIRGHLEVFALKQRLAGEKSFDSPSGKIKSRQSGASFNVDSSTFIEWANTNNRDDLLLYTVKPDLSKIKKSFVASDQEVVDPATGETVAGILPVPERLTFTIEPNLEMADLGDDEDEQL